MMTKATKASSPQRKPLTALLDRPIAFHRIYVTLTGSINAALMLSQAIYWSQRTNPGADSWFYKTRDQWTEETGLSRREQQSGRAALSRFAFWEEKLAGSPAKVHYRVDRDALIDALQSLGDEDEASCGTFCTSCAKRTNHEDQNVPTERIETSQPDGTETPISPYRDYTETTAESTHRRARETTDSKPVRSGKSEPVVERSAADPDPGQQLALLFLSMWEARYKQAPRSNAASLRVKFREMLDAGATEDECREVIERYLLDTADRYWANSAHAAPLMFSQWDRILAAPKASVALTIDEEAAALKERLNDWRENGDEFEQIGREQRAQAVKGVVIS